MSCPNTQPASNQYNINPCSAGQSTSSSVYSRSQGWSSSSAANSTSASTRNATGNQQQQYNSFQSQIEQAVINAKEPIQVQERQQITVGPYRGIHLNRQEEQQFRGPIEINQYKIHDDSNPEVIRKRLDRIRYQQEVAVKYLQPPSPPRPGDLVIKERSQQVPPAPPVVLRQEADRASTPTPLVLRERPPRVPSQVPEQVIEVEGQAGAPPPRRVVLEKLTSLPPKPQNVIIEKWLPYKQQKRRVVYQRSSAQAPQNPRNLIIEWEAPEAEVEKVCRELGVERADPEEYVRRYGPELKDPSELPTCDGQQQRPYNQCGASSSSYSSGSTNFASSSSSGQNQESSLPELEGDVQALKLIDLERHGLGAYRQYLNF